MAIDMSEKKLEVAQDTASYLGNYIDRLFDNARRLENNSVYHLKREEFIARREQLQKSIGEKSYLLFIGPYSSGKSSFVNALFGKDILPTAAAPCTAVVTELNFVKGESSRGKIIKKNKEEESVSYDELLQIINGPLGAVGDVGNYHHVELNVDIETLGDDGKKFEPLIGKVCIVDCPGFGAKYATNEKVITEYIEKASFTFWMCPADDFGGAGDVARLSALKKKTTTLFPLIAKSDLIENEDDKNEIIEQFNETLSGMFKNRSPRFVSAKYFKKAMEIYNKNHHKDDWQKEDENGNSSAKSYYSFLEKSGVNQIIADMADCSQDKEINEAKLDSVLFDLQEVLRDLQNRAGDEKAYWESELKKLGYDEKDSRWKEFEATQREIQYWINDESESVGKNIQMQTEAKLTDKIIEKKGAISPTDINDIVSGTADTIIKEKVDSWEKKFKNMYQKFCDNILTSVATGDIKKDGLESLGANPMDELLKSGLGLLDGLKYAGPSSIVQGAVGGILLGSASEIAAVKFVGGALSMVFGIAGPALIVCAVLPLIKPITDAVKNSKEEYRKKISNEVQLKVQKINYPLIIKNVLNKCNDDCKKIAEEWLDKKIAEPKEHKDNLAKLEEDIAVQLNQIKTLKS